MFPTIASFGQVTIHAFGFCLFLGFLTCLFVIWKRAREEGLPEEKVIDVFFLATGALVIFGRIGYAIGNLGVFLEDFGRIFLFIRYPGLTISWGLVFASVLVVMLARLFLMPALLILDIFFLGVAAASPFLFLGKYLSGGFYENRFLPLGLAICFLILFVLLRFATEFVRKSPELVELRKRPGWLVLCYLIFAELSFLISSYIVTHRVSNFDLVVFIFAVFGFIVRYHEFLKGVKWSSFPRAFYHKLKNIWKNGTMRLKRE